MAEYRVAELARAAGTSVRNVRVYQDRGLLPPPRRMGRIGLYNDEHLSRLRLIGQLLARGYTFATIGELFDAWHQGRDLADSLGLRAALSAPAVQEKPISVTRAELNARLGSDATTENLSRAVDLGILATDGGQYLATSPDLLDAGGELARAGVPFEALLDLAAAVQDDLDRVAQRFVDLFSSPPNRPEPSDEEEEEEDERDQTEVTQRVIQLRPHAQRTTQALLLLAIQRQTHRLRSRSDPTEQPRSDATEQSPSD